MRSNRLQFDKAKEKKNTPEKPEVDSFSFFIQHKKDLS